MTAKFYYLKSECKPYLISNDKVHREDGPAIEALGRKIWCMYGLEHRRNHLSYEDEEDKKWHFHGEYHHLDGEANVYIDYDEFGGYEVIEHYIHGIEIK